MRRPCGHGGEQACRCSSVPRHLRSEEIGEVFVFLRRRLGLRSELSLENLIRSLCAESLRAVLSVEGRENLAYLPTASELGLSCILGIVWKDPKQVADILAISRQGSPERLHACLCVLKAPWVIRLLMLHNLTCGGQVAYLSDSLRLYKRYWEDSADSFASSVQRLEDDLDDSEACAALARVLVIAYRTEASISNLGHCDLRTLDLGARVLRCVHLNPYLPSPLQRLVLCHELVHAALWLRKPYAKTGWHSNEEVFCHAAMVLFAAELRRLHPEHQDIIEHRSRLCIKDAHRRDSKLYSSLHQMLTRRETDAAIARLLVSIN